MVVRKITGILMLLCVVAGSLVAQDQKRGPSTPEERERVVQIARAYEKNPLDKMIVKDREWLLLLLIKVPDIHIRVCESMMPGVAGNKKNNGTELMLQSMFSQAAFQIENPDQAEDDHANYLAGVEGILNAYEAIRAKKKKVKIEELNALLERREDGTLGEFVTEAMEKCQLSPIKE